MPSTLFEQTRYLLAQIRQNYFAISHENEDLRKEILKLKKENDQLKRDLEKTTQEVPTTDVG